MAKPLDDLPAGADHDEIKPYSWRASMTTEAQRRWRREYMRRYRQDHPRRARKKAATA